MSTIEETDVNLLHTKQKQLSQHNYAQVIHIAACATRLQEKQSTAIPNKHYLSFALPFAVLIIVFYVYHERLSQHFTK